jgi:hypothetical protein
MIDVEPVKRQVLREGTEDYVGLWSIIWQIRYILNHAQYPTHGEDRADPMQVRRHTLALVQELLDQGLVKAGTPTPDGKGFKPWPLEPHDVVGRIQSEWDALGREPNIGEVVWFTATEKGPKELEGLTEEGASPATDGNSPNLTP